MNLLLIITLLTLLFSFAFDRQKTVNALKIAGKMFINIVPSILTVLIFVALILALLPKDVLAKLFGENSGVNGFVLAALIGSVSLIPSFVVYPLSSMLIKNGASYPIIAVFITTLMMVGIVTLPLEKKFFGLKISLMRNFLSFIGAILIGLAIAFIWGLK